MIFGKPWSCVLDAFCLATNIPAEEYLKIIGHDGSDFVELPFSDGKYIRGFSTDELTFAALQFGWWSTELTPCLRLQASAWPTHYNTERNLAKEYVEKNPDGTYVMCTMCHAFAYVNAIILDPANRIISLPDFSYLSTVYTLKKCV